MGFSPTWGNHFLFLTATLFGASFSEAAPLAWDEAAVDEAMQFVQDWTKEANTSMQFVDDFAFRYLYFPPANLVLSGRILFTSMDSGSYFTLGEGRRGGLAFRWLAEKDTIPVSEKNVYLGLARKGQGTKAAKAFLEWFFDADTQRFLLEKSRQYRMAETSFGIGGGFSAMRTVTEQVFPQFYPDLLGHVPPEDFLSPPNILPSNWLAMKEQVVLPYLQDRARGNGIANPLERRLADWSRINQR
jgi:hypothetical protein